METAKFVAVSRQWLSDVFCNRYRWLLGAEQVLTLTDTTGLSSINQGDTVIQNSGGTPETSAITNVATVVGGWNGFAQPVGQAVGIAYGNGMYVSAGNSPRQLMYSPDAVSWTTVDIATKTWVDVAFGDGKFVLVADNHETLYSSNGIDWTEGVSRRKREQL